MTDTAPTQPPAAPPAFIANLLSVHETPEQRAAIEADAKALAASMLEVEIAGYAVRANSRITALELAAQRHEQREASLGLRDRAVQLRDRIEVHIRDLKPQGDRLYVARDLLTRVIELVA